MSLVETWRDRGLCLSIDPREFDDGGTPIAWNACRQCPVVAECLADAKAAPERTHGVYRAGREWGVKAAYRPRRSLRDIQADHRDWVEMANEGTSIIEIARVYGCHHSTVARVLRMLQVSA